MNIRNMGQGLGAGGLASGLMGLFGNQKDPYKDASKMYGQIPGQVAPYYQPYMHQGMQALGQLPGQYQSLMSGLPGLQGQYNQMMNDPMAMYNNVAQGYEKSPGFDWQLGQGMNAAGNAAMSGGMAGSPQHQQQAATMATGLANQDFHNYMNNALGSANAQQGMGLQGQQGLYGMGLQGMQGLNNMGFQGNDQMARLISDMMSQQGQMKFAGQAAQNQSQGQNWGNIFGGLASIFGMR